MTRNADAKREVTEKEKQAKIQKQLDQEFLEEQDQAISTKGALSVAKMYFKNQKAELKRQKTVALSKKFEEDKV